MILSNGLAIRKVGRGFLEAPRISRKRLGLEAVFVGYFQNHERNY